MTSSPTRSTKLSSLVVSSFTKPLEEFVAVEAGGSLDGFGVSGRLARDPRDVGSELWAGAPDSSLRRTDRTRSIIPCVGTRMGVPEFLPWSCNAHFTREVAKRIRSRKNSSSMISEVISSSDRRTASSSDSSSCAKLRTASNWRNPAPPLKV